jgi:hypothetical protein
MALISDTNLLVFSIYSTLFIEVARNTFFQVLGFAHIDEHVFFIEKTVNSRVIGKIQYILRIESGDLHRPKLVNIIVIYGGIRGGKYIYKLLTIYFHAQVGWSLEYRLL